MWETCVSRELYLLLHNRAPKKPAEAPTETQLNPTEPNRTQPTYDDVGATYILCELQKAVLACWKEEKWNEKIQKRFKQANMTKFSDSLSTELNSGGPYSRGWSEYFVIMCYQCKLKC